MHEFLTGNPDDPDATFTSSGAYAVASEQPLVYTLSAAASRWLEMYVLAYGGNVVSHVRYAVLQLLLHSADREAVRDRFPVMFAQMVPWTFSLSDMLLNSISVRMLSFYFALVCVGYL